MYSFDGRVRYSECDERGNLTLLALINYLQDCTTFHSESIGRGVSHMRGRGIAWLIAAWQIEIGRLPRFCDDIRVSTWCHSMARTLATRNFTICDGDGTPLVRADSLWFVYDLAAGRPIRIPEDQRVYLSDEPPLDMPPTVRRLPVGGPCQTAPAITVGELHLDTNRHVNNAQYLGMATNAIAAVFGHDIAAHVTDIARVCIQYRRQALLADTIVPRVHVDGGVCTVDLADPDGDTFAVVRIELRSRGGRHAGGTGA
ncbi:MAG: thioesterase [Acidobacteriota bacterium]|nr:thioesterase [Acidobacteriota bacterium]